MPHGDSEAGEDLDHLFVEYRRTGDRRLRNRLVEAHLAVAAQEARRFANRGEPLDDLLQVARMGVLKAVERFDPDLGVPFTAYARPTVAGELRRHFRDATWSVHVPRGLKDLHAGIGKASAQLAGRLGRPPTAAELAAEMRCTVDEVLEAIDLRSAYRPASLSAPTQPGGVRPDPVAEDDAGDVDHAIDRVALRDLLDRLPQRERTIVYLRFFGQLSQVEIAERVGVSQVHVSRLLRASLDSLRELIDAEASIDSASRQEGLSHG